MPKPVFEGTNLKVKCEIKGWSGKVTFVFLKDGEELQKKEEHMSGQTARCELELPDVADDQDVYKLEYYVTREGDTDRFWNTDEYLVYPRNVQVKALNANDGAAMTGFRFDILQNGEHATTSSTRSDGTFSYQLRHAAPFSVEPRAPFEVTEWTKPKGRAREAKVKRNYKAEFVKPLPKTGGEKWKQYVNLTTGESGRDAKGRDLHFIVGGVGDANKPVDQRTAQLGDKVYIKVTYADTTQRTQPQFYLGGAQNIVKTDTEHKGHVEMNAQGQGTFFVRLPFVGGAKVTVKIGTTETCEDKTFELETWRKIHYQLTRPAGVAAPDDQRLKDALAGTFIEYDRFREREYDDSVGPAGTWVDGGLIGQTAGTNYPIAGSHNRNALHTALFQNGTCPEYEVHVLYCQWQCDGEGTATASVEVDDTDIIAFPGAGNEVGAEFKGSDFDADGDHKVIKTSLETGGAAVTATWKSKAAAGPHVGAGAAIPADHIVVGDFPANKADYGKISVKLPAAALAVVNDGENVKIKVTAYGFSGPFMGEAWSEHMNWLLIGLGDDDTAAYNANQINDTMAHELGHTLHMCMDDSFPAVPGIADARTEHGAHYTGHKDSGDHCKTGVTNAGAGANTAYRGGSCLMFGHDDNANAGTFCAACTKMMKMLEIADVRWADV